MMMDRILLGVLCLSGWIFSSGLLRQYHYVSDPKNWTEAQNYCRETYTDLATIENTKEMNQLINTVSSAGNNSEVWIGLYSKIKWRWSDDYKGSIAAEYRYWYTSQTYFYNGSNDLCVGINYHWLWQTLDCSSNFSFICNNGTQLDPKFIYVNEALNWSSAQRYCREHFRDLANVRNYKVNQKLRILLTTESWTWIGLFVDPHINWSDGSNLSFRYWNTTNTTTALTTDMCSAADLNSSGKWNFLSCETRLPFVCYDTPPPVTRQVVKLRIKDSSVDLNDPAVKADILNKLQDRLQEKGVSGVTLKWREQPDGKVFHKDGGSSQRKNRRNSEL